MAWAVSESCADSGAHGGVATQGRDPAPGVLSVLAVGAVLVPTLSVLSSLPASAASGTAVGSPLYVSGIPLDFILFALTLLGVALFHRQTLQVALIGLAAIVGYK